MNNALENNFFSRIGRFISRPKVRFTIERKHDLAIQFSPEELGEVPDNKSRDLPLSTSKQTDKFATNSLPAGTLAFLAFKKIVETAANQEGSASYLLEMHLNPSNCSFLSDVDRKDLAIDCLKEVIRKGISPTAYTFSPTHKIWLFFAHIPTKMAINKANTAFLQTQQLVRAELDFHRSLIELNMYKIQDCVPKID